MKPAHDFLTEAANQLGVKAQLRDQPQGERSMARTVMAFNALTGNDISESDGWKFMVLLKMVRSQQGKFNEDDYVDGAAYFGLLGECESKSVGEPIAPEDIPKVETPLDQTIFTNDNRTVFGSGYKDPLTPAPSYDNTKLTLGELSGNSSKGLPHTIGQAVGLSTKPVSTYEPKINKGNLSLSMFLWTIDTHKIDIQRYIDNPNGRSQNIKDTLRGHIEALDVLAYQVRYNW